MTRIQYVPDSSGFEKVLLGCQAAIDEAAARTAAEVRGSLPADGKGDVVVDQYRFTPKGRTSARAAASVAVRRHDAKLLQARDGLLTRAAAAAGLEVNGDPS